MNEDDPERAPDDEQLAEAAAHKKTILGKIVDAEKATGKPIRLVRMRVAAKAVRLLFRELVKEMT